MYIQSASPNTRLVIKNLVSHGADVNSRDAYGSTPLFFAVLRGNLTAVEELLNCPDIDLEVQSMMKILVTSLN